MEESNPEVLTIEEAARFLRIPLSSMYHLAQDGKVPCQKVGRHWRFHRQTLVQWMAAGISVDGKRESKSDRLDFS